MIDFLIAAVATLLVLLGLAIIVGPDLPRLAKLLRGSLKRLAGAAEDAAAARRDRVAPPRMAGGANPTTLRAISNATTIVTILRRNGHDELASRLAYATKRLATDEAAGLRSLLALRARLERVRVDDEAGQGMLDRLLPELHQAVTDRAEQLELLPFPG